MDSLKDTTSLLDEDDSDGSTSKCERRPKKFASADFIVPYHLTLHLMSIRQDTCIGLLETGRYQGDHIWQPYGCMMHNYSQADLRHCLHATVKAEHIETNHIVIVGTESRARQIYNHFVQRFDPELKQKKKHLFDTHGRSISYREDSAPIQLDLVMAEDYGHYMLKKLQPYFDQERPSPSIMIFVADFNPITLNRSVADNLDNFTNQARQIQNKIDDIKSKAKKVKTYSYKPTELETKPDESTLMMALNTELYETLELINQLKIEQNKVLMEEYQKNLTNLLPYIHNLLNSNRTNVLWIPQPGVDEWRLRNDISENETNKEIPYRNSKINELNAVAETVLRHTNVRVWHSAAQIFNGYMADSADGVALGKVTLNYNFQMLCNFYCNSKVRYGDGTCCGKPENLTTVQMIAFTVYILCMALAVFFALLRFSVSSWWNLLVQTFSSAPDESCSLTPVSTDSLCQRSMLNNEVLCGNKHHHKMRAFDIIFAMAKLSAIMLFFYACDRADFFMKENKWFTYFNLFLPIIYLSVLGVFFAEDTKNAEFLPRDQSEEWRGLMQLIILSSHLTGAIEVRWVYMLNRCLISAYLFLLGYGHFMYYWMTSDFSLLRVIRVLFRYNLLVVLLCVTMNRPYQFYSFVPLVSIWYLTVFVTMWLPPRVHSANIDSLNQSFKYTLLTCKLVFMFSLISILYMSEIFFETISTIGPWRLLFTTSNPNGSVFDWWQKWTKDRYSTPFGMVVAFIVCVMRESKLLNEKVNQLLFSRKWSLIALLVSIGGLLSYSLILSNCRSRTECDEWHAYIVLIPIVAYLIIRNLFGSIRSKASHFFAWFGRIALELFTAEHHIWLVSDSNGVLVLLPRTPVLNVIVTSYIFICIAHELREITVRLVPVIVPGGESTPSTTVVQKKPTIFTALACVTVVACLYFSSSVFNETSTQTFYEKPN